MLSSHNGHKDNNVALIFTGLLEVTTVGTLACFRALPSLTKQYNMKEQKTIHCVFHHGSRSKAPKADLGHQDIIFVYTLSILHSLQFRNGIRPRKHSFPTSLLS